MFSISFFSPADQTEVRADGTWESERKARNYAAKLADRFQDVVVWRGHPGEFRVATLNARCDKQRFGESCAVCEAA